MTHYSLPTMKQILQNLKTGKIELAEVPAPHLKEGHILVESRTSLISAGTERMLMDLERDLSFSLT